jgi:hypothetical protein
MGGAAVGVSIVDPYFVSYNSTLQSMSEGLSAHQTNFGFHACSMCARASPVALALQVLSAQASVLE